tara:strand:- start:25 stop:2358 length:2334 start_codon:yes stop_codon:yes gene_type:complete
MKKSVLSKLVIPAILAAVLVAATTAGIGVYQRSQTSVRVTEELDAVAQNNLERIARDMYAMVQAVHELVQQQVGSGLRVLESLVDDAGEPRLTDELRSWTVTNQDTGETRSVDLPSLVFGSTEIVPEDSFDRPVPFVDRTQELVGGTSTIFLRMNEAGDMLRVASTVRSADGTRAVGTYIPAESSDGSENDVIRTLLIGGIYRGRALVMGEYYQTAYEPLFDARGAVIGAIYMGVRQEAVESLRQSMIDVEIGDTGYVFALEGTGPDRGRYIVSDDGARDGENIWDARAQDGRLFIQELIQGAIDAPPGEPYVVVYPWTNSPGEPPSPKMSATIYFPPWDWVIGAGVSLVEFGAAGRTVNAALTRLVRSIIAAGLLVALLAGTLTFLIGRRLVRPIRNAGVRLQEIAEGGGDLTARMEVESQDEIGGLSRDFNEFLGTLQRMIGEIQDAVRNGTTVQGELLTSSTETSAAINEITANISSVERMIQNLRGEVSSVSAATEQIQRNTEQLSGQAESQSSAVAESTASVEEMIASLHHVAEITSARSGSAERLLQEAERNSKLASGATEQIREVRSNVDSIRDMTEVIASIASQTNLLAMNAAIEAAHAGETGKGFAVVSDEIRKLAETSSESSQQIAGNVARIVEHIEGSAEAMETLQDQLETVVGEIRQTAEAFAEIHGSTTEMSTGGDEIVRAMQMLNEISEGVVSAIREITQSSGDTARSMSAVSELTGQVTGATEEISSGAKEIMNAMDHLQSQAHTLEEVNRGLAEQVNRFQV